MNDNLAYSPLRSAWPFDEIFVPDYIIIFDPSDLDRAAPKPDNDTRAEQESAGGLYGYVTSRNGEVDSGIARRFINNAIYGGFDSIDPALRNDLSSLSKELRLNLYTSLTRDAGIQANMYQWEAERALYKHMEFVDALHGIIGEDIMQDLRDYRARQDEKLREIFGNKKSMQATWRNWKKKGPGAELFGDASFADVMGTALYEPEKLNLDQRFALLQFIEDAVARRTGRKSFDVGAYTAEQGNLGFTNREKDVIGINVASNTFLYDFRYALITILHEGATGHAQQIALARDLKEGKIKPGNPDYVAARMFAANFQEAGYIPPMLGEQAYRNSNSVELDAFPAGFNGLKILEEAYGRKRHEFAQAARETTRDAEVVYILDVTPGRPPVVRAVPAEGLRYAA